MNRSCKCACIWCRQGNEDMCGLNHLAGRFAPQFETDEWEFFEENVGYRIARECDLSVWKEVKDFISTNYIKKSELEKVLEIGSGGGNWRRLIIQLLEK